MPILPNDKEMTEHYEIGPLADDRKASSDHLEALGVARVSKHTAEEERALLRRLDRRVLPWIMLLYMLSYLDRSNLGNSVALGLKKDLKLVGSEYSGLQIGKWASALFYFATFFFGTIGALMLKIVKPRYYLAVCCVGWGGMAMAQAGATGFSSLGAIRFLLGLFEASFAPGCAFYLSFWYTKDELTSRIAAYAGTSAVSGIVGGLVSYGFGFANTNLLKGWQWLFISEGLPTVLVGLATPFMLPDRPEQSKASWMSDAEYAIAMERRNRYVTNTSESKINWAQVRGALVDYRLWLFAVIYSGLSLSLAVISIFLPSLLAVMGYAGYKSNLMTVPPYAVGYLGLLAVATLSNRFKQRAIPITLASGIGGVGYLVVGLDSTPGVRFFGSFLVVAGTYWSFPVVLAWVSNTFAADAKAGTGLGVDIAVTHAVGVAAAHIYPSKDSPQYRTGSIVSAALMFASAVGAVVMRWLLKRENRRRDQTFGSNRQTQLVLGDKADKNPEFRYTL